MRKKDEGFSLIEGVVAIFIVAILVALIGLTVNSDQNQVSLTDAKVQSVSIANSLFDATSNTSGCGDLTALDSVYASQQFQPCTISSSLFPPSPSTYGLSLPTYSNGAPNIGLCNSPSLKASNISLSFDSPSPWLCASETANKFLVQSTSTWVDPSPPSTCPAASFLYAPKMIKRQVKEYAVLPVGVQTYSYQREQIFRLGSLQAGQQSPSSLIFEKVPSNQVVILQINILDSYNPGAGSISQNPSPITYYLEAAPNSNGTAVFPYLSDVSNAAGTTYQYALSNSLAPSGNYGGSLQFSSVVSPNMSAPTTCVEAS